MRSQGVASALNDVTREFGTALGVALLGAVLTAGYRSAIDARLDGVPRTPRRHRPRRRRQRPRGRGRRRPPRAGADPSRPGVLRRRLAAGHVGRRRSSWRVLFVYVALRGPKNTLSASAKEETPDQVTA